MTLPKRIANRSENMGGVIAGSRMSDRSASWGTPGARWDQGEATTGPR